MAYRSLPNVGRSDDGPFPSLQGSSSNAAFAYIYIYIYERERERERERGSPPAVSRELTRLCVLGGKGELSQNNGSCSQQLLFFLDTL